MPINKEKKSADKLKNDIDVRNWSMMPNEPDDCPTYVATIETPEEAAVNHPPHYTGGNIECIDAIRSSMTDMEFQGYLRGNILKYLWRFRHKNGTEDLRKARWYLDKLIEAQGVI